MGFSSKTGIFLLKNVPSGQYTLLVQSIGYAKYNKNLNISSNNDTVKIGTIRLGTLGYLTDEVEVTAIANRVELKGDTTEFSANSFKTDKNATAEELDTLPGIGPATAAKIIAARAEKPFVIVDDLRDLKIISESVLQGIRALVIP